MIQTVRYPASGFHVGNTYVNNRGKYRVLAISGTLMHVRYVTGARATLLTTVQARIIARRWRQQNTSRQAGTNATDGKNTRRISSLNSPARSAAAREADRVDYWFGEPGIEPEHRGRCGKNGKCPLCTGVW